MSNTESKYSTEAVEDEQHKKGLRQKIKNFFLFFIPGIRVKLAFFIGILIALTLTVVSFVNLQQQSNILSDSYDREAAISRRYISSFVVELDNIAQNLIRIEKFRDRIKTQQMDRKKFQSTKTFVYKKKSSFFGLVGGGTGYVSKKQDTYYSAYLTDTDIKNLETQTRFLLQVPGEPPISDAKFKKLLFLANRYAQGSKTVQFLESKIAEEKNETTKENLEKNLLAARGTERLRRYYLDNEITGILYSSLRKKIKELGLDTSRFRIQTFPDIAIVPGENTHPTLDTNIFDKKSTINQDINDPALQSNLVQAYQSLVDSRGVKKNLLPLELNFNELKLQVLYSPHYRNPLSSIRVRALFSLRKEKTRFQHIKDFLGKGDPNEKDINQYLLKDNEIGLNLRRISASIEKRVSELKTKKPPVPPNKDKEFLELYRDYGELILQRNKNFDEFYKNKSEILKPSLLDAIGNIRDASLEDQVLIHFKGSSFTYDEYLESKELQAVQKKRWLALRNWIYAGQSETPPDLLKRQFQDGMIGFSRSEAEAIMWKLDSRPLLSSQGDDVASYISETNFAGVIRTIVDRTSGLTAIQLNRERILYTALGIAAIVFLMTFYFSGIIVKKIKGLIKNAQAVGKGNLNVEFAKGGHDEIGQLSLSLNHMVSGLREREKIKGILGSMIDPVVIGEAMKDLQALKDGTEKNITAFFSDIAGFSSISEKLSSVELAALLNEYLSAMTIHLKEYDGVLDKYIGDAIVGIFNAPVDVENHTLKAVQASLRMVETMQHMRLKWIQEDKYIPEARDMHFRIGLNTGPAKVGFMGTDALASYTMMGDTVNLAARLEAAAKDYGVTILASQSVYAEVNKTIFGRKLDLIRVKGKNEPVTIYELITDTKKASIPRGIKDSAELYEAGLELYLNKNWGKAIQTFQESEKIKGREDKAVQLLIRRIEEYRKSPPPDDWDGAFTRDHK